ncbi:MAG: hypothetical protein L0H36_01835 [bacterium]|nr:hypothetical protein [bacterium]
MRENTALNEMEKMQNKLRSTKRWFVTWAILATASVCMFVMVSLNYDEPATMWQVILPLYFLLFAIPLAVGQLAASIAKYFEALSDLQTYRIQNYR